jgi:hypothetical protein
MAVTDEGPRVFWGDLHGHSGLSDGTGIPDDYFRYARDVAHLDIAALTDHDHWGIVPLDSSPAMWSSIQKSVGQFHEPWRFVPLLGYEWTSWLHGHRHVLFFGDRADLLSSLDPRFDSPARLWEAFRSEAPDAQALHGNDALTLAHHPAGGPMATDWTNPPDPLLEPVVEIASVHGSSEAPDSPGSIYDPVAGNFVRDALRRGYRLGFVASGDSHDGHPGLAGLSSPTGGLAAILADDLTRAGVRAALEARRVYATNGPRILLRATLDGAPMGSLLRPGPTGEIPERTLRAVAVAPAAIQRLDLIRTGDLVASEPGNGQRDLGIEKRLEHLRSGEYLYLRVIQEDGGAAWSSPFFVE